MFAVAVVLIDPRGNSGTCLSPRREAGVFDLWYRFRRAHRYRRGTAGVGRERDVRRCRDRLEPGRRGQADLSDLGLLVVFDTVTCTVVLAPGGNVTWSMGRYPITGGGWGARACRR